MELDLRWSHHLLLPCEATSVRRARRFAHDALEQHDLAELTLAVELVVSELATNATVHARTPFSVTMSGDDDAVLVKVRDRSSTPPVPAAPTPPAFADGGDDTSRIGGRGLGLVSHFSSEWGVQPDATATGKTVWAAFNIA